MTIDSAAQKIWDYLHLNHSLKKADVIMVLGNRDTRMARHAAQLYLDGWAPLLLCSGSGTKNNHMAGREQFVGTTEAEIFANIAIEMGVPADKIILEKESQNTRENYELSLQKLKEHNINPTRIILVQKPYTERRIHAMGKTWLPNAELIISSPEISLEQYPDQSMDKKELLNVLVGGIQRIKDDHKKGGQIEQEVPNDVLEAYDFLIKEGFTERLMKG